MTTLIFSYIPKPFPTDHVGIWRFWAHSVQLLGVWRIPWQLHNHHRPKGMLPSTHYATLNLSRPRKAPWKFFLSWIVSNSVWSTSRSTLIPDLTWFVNQLCHYSKWGTYSRLYNVRVFLFSFLFFFTLSTIVFCVFSLFIEVSNLPCIL